MRLFSKLAINDASDLGSEKVILTLIDDVQLKESRAGVPLTSIAAHVVDEEVDIELDDKIEKTETAPAEFENEVAFKARSFPLLPPTLTSSGTNYSRYEGDDENVDVDGLDEEAAITRRDIA